MAAEFQQTKVHCTDKGKDFVADILHKSDKTLKVVLVGNNIAIHMRRQDTKRQYVGQVGTFEFTSKGEII